MHGNKGRQSKFIIQCTLSIKSTLHAFFIQNTYSCFVYVTSIVSNFITSFYEFKNATRRYCNSYSHSKILRTLIKDIF